MNSGAGSTTHLLAEVEQYYDAVPRTVARAESIGPFTLFLNTGPGWPYYARPSLGADAFTAADVERVRSRQQAAGVPEAFEWVAETSPSLAAAAQAADLLVNHHPLLVWTEDAAAAAPPPAGVAVRLASVADDLSLLHAIADVAFAAPGTAAGPANLGRCPRPRPRPRPSPSRRASRSGPGGVPAGAPADRPDSNGGGRPRR